MQGSRPVNQEEVEQLKKKLKTKNRLLILTGLYFGTRISEALAITFGDVSGQWFCLKSEKGSNNKTYPIPKPYQDVVEQWRSELKAKGVHVTSKTPLFLSSFKRYTTGKALTRQQASQAIQRACRRLGIDGRVNTHSFRKAFVIKIYHMLGHDIRKTQDYSRHKNLTSLQYYLESSNDLDLVKELGWLTESTG
jgi:integrase